MILRIVLKIEGEGTDKDGLEVNLASLLPEYNCNIMPHGLYLFGISRFALLSISISSSIMRLVLFHPTNPSYLLSIFPVHLQHQNCSQTSP